MKGVQKDGKRKGKVNKISLSNWIFANCSEDEDGWDEGNRDVGLDIGVNVLLFNGGVSSDGGVSEGDHVVEASESEESTTGSLVVGGGG